MKIKLVISIFWIFSGFLSCSPNQKHEAVQKLPNILLIISDDQAWTDYSFMGHPVIQTPRIDKLSEEGLTFTRGYVIAPLCRPSLASIATGLYPHQHGITGNDPFFNFDSNRYGSDWMKLRAEKNQAFIEKFQNNPTIAQRLKEKGYVSYQTGKWWEGSWKDGGFTDGMTHGDFSRGGRHGDEGLKVGREGMQNMFDFIAQAQKEEKPFFVWHAPFMPHTPHTPPDSLLQKYLPITKHERVAKYMAMVEWFDITVGQLLDHLKENDLEENTLVVYVCDNGWITNPNPKKGGLYMPRSKQSPYEMGIRTPIMYKWPGVITPKMDTTTFVSSIDIVPTILGVVALDQPSHMYGLNILEKDNLHERESVFSEDFTHDMADIDDMTKSLESRVILNSPWKLILPYDKNNNMSTELFNIMEDPHELHNLAKDNPNIVKELTQQLDDFWFPGE